MKRLLIALVRLYQLALSPLFPPSCRFVPTCSHYALEAIELHGAWRGSWLALRRILRCHPFHPGGFDPVVAPAGRPGIHDDVLTPNRKGSSPWKTNAP
ncbi:MAG: membrane protein insertion efficiency factor YidD [Thermodesulfobacteriota bacterium]